MDVLCTFITSSESQHSKYGCITDPPSYTNCDQDPKHQSGTSSILQISNLDFQDMKVLCTFKIKIESWKMKYGCIKDQ